MRRSDRAPDEGAAAVEFAFVSVLLLTLVFGIMQYGFFFLQATGVEAAVREGARTAGVDGPDLAAAAVADAAPDGVSPTTSICWRDADGGGAYTRGDVLSLTVTWQPTRFGFPFVPFLTGEYEDSATARVERTAGITPPADQCPALPVPTP